MTARTMSRGDSYELKFARTEDGVAADITGRTYLMTVHTVKAPVDDTTQVFQVVGVITDAGGGLFGFTPTEVQTDLAPATYYFDVEERIPANGFVTTLEVDKFKITQDLSKD